MGSRKESASSSRSSTEKPPAFAEANAALRRDEVRIGRVGRSHGTQGAFVVNEPTERVELLDAGRTVTVAGAGRTVEWRRGTADKPIVKLEGVDGRAIRGEAIMVRRSELGPLAEDEFLVDDLIGAEVLDGERRLGRVRDVLLLPSADVLEVEGEAGEPVLVPLVADAVRSIDVAAGEVQVDAGFLYAD